MTTDLAAWLLADDGPIAATEAEARALLRIAQDTCLMLKEPKLLGRQIPGWHSWPDVERLCQRALDECAAKRTIVGMYQTSALVVETTHDTILGGAARLNRRAYGEVIKALAQPYSGRPGWRDEWATP